MSKSSALQRLQGLRAAPPSPSGLPGILIVLFVIFAVLFIFSASDAFTIAFGIAVGGILFGFGLALANRGQAPKILNLPGRR